MTIRDLIIKLGGQGAVADRLGLKRNSIAMWNARGAVPPEYHLALWRMSLAAGLTWQPRGAEGLRDLLCHGSAGGEMPEEDVAQVEVRLAHHHAGAEAELTRVSQRLAEFHGEAAKPGEAA